MKHVVIAGNAVTAEIIYSYLKNDNRYRVVAVTVDDVFLNQEKYLDGIPSVSISQLELSFSQSSVAIVMAIGYSNLNKNREFIYNRLKSLGYIIETYIHPDAKVYVPCEAIGEGTVILPGAVVEPNVKIGANSFIWCNSTLAHHCNVSENCWIASGAVISGQAKVKHNSFVGVNATIVNKVVVGEFNIIGAGALISKDTKPNSVYLSRTAENLRYSAKDYTKYFLNVTYE